MRHSFLTSSIGRKQLMGLAGLGFAAFTLGHMSGNLTMFISGEAYNRYGHAIVSNKLLLYGTEIFLVAALLVHFTMGIWITVENRRARKTKYSLPTSGDKAARLASKSMIYHGVVILIFIVLHLITFKYGPHYTVTYEDGVEMRDLYRLLVEVFQRPVMVWWYVIALMFLFFHLFHGISSSFQTLGIQNPRYMSVIKKIGMTLALVIAAGFIAQPLYIHFFVHS